VAMEVNLCVLTKPAKMSAHMQGPMEEHSEESGQSSGMCL